MMERLTRREMMLTSGILAGISVVARGQGEALAQAGQNANEALVKRKRVLRVAHLTDAHVQPERGAGYGLVDLFDDGTFENRYVEYGWKARE